MAELMGVSKRLIFRWRAEGKLPPYDFAEGQTKRWRLTTVTAWIEQRKKAS
jgi:excisionase family DNA binding protein